MLKELYTTIPPKAAHGFISKETKTEHRRKIVLLNGWDDDMNSSISHQYICQNDSLKQGCQTHNLRAGCVTR